MSRLPRNRINELPDNAQPERRDSAASFKRFSSVGAITLRDDGIEERLLAAREENRRLE